MAPRRGLSDREGVERRNGSRSQGQGGENGKMVASLWSGPTGTHRAENTTVLESLIHHPKLSLFFLGIAHHSLHGFQAL